MVHFTETPNSKVKLQTPQFKCDFALGNHIPDPLPRKHFYMAICGSAGSGKTSMALGLLTAKGKHRIYRKVFDNIFLVVPSNSIGSLKQNVFKKHPPSKMFNSLDVETIDKINTKLQKSLDEEDDEQQTCSLVWIDDQGPFLKRPDIQTALNEVVINRRHKRVSIMNLVQSYKFLPLSNRKLLTHLVLFKPKNKKELYSVFEELIYLDRDTVDKLCDFVYRDPHDFMFIDLERSKFYRNFNLIEIKEKNPITQYNARTEEQKAQTNPEVTKAQPKAETTPER